MGGGGAQLAAAKEPSLRAVVALCPWLGPTQLTNSRLNHSVPLLIISGQRDEIAPPKVQANAQYDYTPSTTDKLLYEVREGGHSVANAPDFRKEGLSYSNGEVGRVALSWLKVYLVGDTSYRPLLFDVPKSASSYETNIK
jgi:predicted dienelactone hydrolase